MPASSKLPLDPQYKLVHRRLLAMHSWKNAWKTVRPFLIPNQITLRHSEPEPDVTSVANLYRTSLPPTAVSVEESFMHALRNISRPSVSIHFSGTPIWRVCQLLCHRKIVPRSADKMFRPSQPYRSSKSILSSPLRVHIAVRGSASSAPWWL